ncbi:MAG: hypothetical protein QG670_436 [Thermoproteota archaeon]|nr:hypothetical protein [Thermoproteota archaeon]
MEPGFNEKMDTIDLIINALKDHEKRLDAISERLEDIIKASSTESHAAMEKEEQKAEYSELRKKPQVVCEKWDEFKSVSTGASVIAFGIENSFFYTYSLVGDYAFKYIEILPNRTLRIKESQSSFTIDKTSLSNIELLEFLVTNKLNCGLSLSIEIKKVILSQKEYILELNYNFNPDDIKEFLSSELNVLKSSIIEGKITY